MSEKSIVCFCSSVDIVAEIGILSLVSTTCIAIVELWKYDVCSSLVLRYRGYYRLCKELKPQNLISLTRREIAFVLNFYKIAEMLPLSSSWSGVNSVASSQTR